MLNPVPRFCVFALPLFCVVVVVRVSGVVGYWFTPCNWLPFSLAYGGRFLFIPYVWRG